MNEINLNETYIKKITDLEEELKVCKEKHERNISYHKEKQVKLEIEVNLLKDIIMNALKRDL